MSDPLFKVTKDEDEAPVWVCMLCGTRVKRGQPHRAASPVPHASLTALIVEEDS